MGFVQQFLGVDLFFDAAPQRSSAFWDRKVIADVRSFQKSAAETVAIAAGKGTDLIYAFFQIAAVDEPAGQILAYGIDEHPRVFHDHGQLGDDFFRSGQVGGADAGADRSDKGIDVYHVSHGVQRLE